MLKFVQSLAIALLACYQLAEAQVSSSFQRNVAKWASLQVAKPEQLIVDAEFQAILVAPTAHSDELLSCLDSEGVIFDERWVCLMLVQRAPWHLFNASQKRMFAAWAKGLISNEDFGGLLATPVHVANRLAILHRTPQISSLLEGAMKEAQARPRSIPIDNLMLTLRSLISGEQRMRSLGVIHDTAQHKLSPFVVQPSSEDNIPAYWQGWEYIMSRPLVLFLMAAALLLLPLFVGIFKKLRRNTQTKT